jgi:hypothetical protein
VFKNRPSKVVTSIAIECWYCILWPAIAILIRSVLGN